MTFSRSSSVIRLTQADFLYVNQVFIRLFPPEKISLLHANVMSHHSWNVCRSQCWPPARTPHSWGSVHLVEPRCCFHCGGRHECMKACASSVTDILLKAEHVSEGLSHLVSSSVAKNPFEPVTETWLTSVLLPANTSWIEATNDRGREQIQLQIP